MTAAPPTVAVTVRYFAAARAAAGADSEIVAMATGSTVMDLVATLRAKGPELARILDRCSFLHDGVAVRDRRQALETTSTVDVLPPFAGG